MIGPDPMIMILLMSSRFGIIPPPRLLITSLQSRKALDGKGIKRLLPERDHPGIIRHLAFSGWMDRFCVSLRRPGKKTKIGDAET